MTQSVSVCQEITPWTLNYAFSFISCLFTKDAFQPMSLLQALKKDPMFSNVTKYKRFIKWICVKKLRTKSFPLRFFFPLRESDTISLSARYFLFSHIHSSGFKTLHVSPGTGHQTRNDRKAEKAEKHFSFMEMDAGWRGMFLAFLS